MRVYLMRHATAEDPVTGPDSGRRLTEQGRREAREAGKALLERGAAPVAILTSPRLRARETAELVAAELGGKMPVEVREPLTCGATSEIYRAELQTRSPGDVLLVAHNPELSSFASSLAGRMVSFRPSTVCCFEIEKDDVRLVWLRQPSQA
jgi:phosphohistidine phosphatase